MTAAPQKRRMSVRWPIAAALIPVGAVFAVPLWMLGSAGDGEGSGAVLCRS